MFIYCCIFIPIMLLFGKNILSWYSPEYVSGYNALCVFIIGYFMSVMFSFVTPILQIMNQNKFVIIMLISLIVINTILNIILIPYWGSLGAAISYSVSTSIILLIETYWLKHKLGIQYIPKINYKKLGFTCI